MRVMRVASVRRSQETDQKWRRGATSDASHFHSLQRRHKALRPFLLRVVRHRVLCRVPAVSAERLAAQQLPRRRRALLVELRDGAARRSPAPRPVEQPVDWGHSREFRIALKSQVRSSRLLDCSTHLSPAPSLAADFYLTNVLIVD